MELDTRQQFLEEETVNKDQKAHADRGSWTGKLDFLLSCLSYAVGLGNLWRFPYVCFSNGGGAFLIPYVIMLVFTGIPLFFLELCFGQFASSGIVSIWQVSPIFQGVGWGMFIVSCWIGVYYNHVIAWSLHYLISSFTTKLPWTDCDPAWKTEACTPLKQFVDLRESCREGIIYNETCHLASEYTNETFAALLDLVGNSSSSPRTSPSHEYFHRQVLQISSGFFDWGLPKIELAMSLLLAWLLVALCLVKGIKSSGKAVYFTATFPYLVLIILLIRGATLPGAVDGIRFYLTPKWHLLTRAKIWGDAAVQIFFSLSPCWGGLITLASYNKFDNNCLRDSIFVSVGNCLTSILAGFVVFSVIGHLAFMLDSDIENVIDKGPSLAFIVYPEVLTQLPISPLWSILFFAMLVTLGLGTQFAVVNTVHTTLVDLFPHKFRGPMWSHSLNLGRYKPKLTIDRSTLVMVAICLVGYIIGLILFCGPAGMYVLTLIDTFSATYSVLLIGLTECVALAYVYGIDAFLNDIKFMLGRRPWFWWKICWRFITPLLLIFIIVFTWVDFKPTEYGNYSFPGAVDGLGWVISMSSVLAIPIAAIVKVWSSYRGSQRGRSLIEVVKLLARPTKNWGPADLSRREQYQLDREARG